MSIDQIEGNVPMHENWGELNLGEDIDEAGDPPRIWSPTGNYPGCVSALFTINTTIAQFFTNRFSFIFNFVNVRWLINYIKLY